MQANRLSFTLTVVLLALVTNACTRGKYDVDIANNVAMKTRDGITLMADIYRPKANGKFPVILERTPYDKRSGVGFGLKAAGRLHCPGRAGAQCLGG